MVIKKTEKVYVNRKGQVNDMIEDMNYYYIIQLLAHYGMSEDELAELCAEYPELRIAIEKRYPEYQIKEVSKKAEAPKQPKPEPKKLDIDIKEEK